MTATPEQCDAIRRRELAEQMPPLNDRFQSYVTSTAFSMSLSRSMIRTLLGVEQAVLKKLEYSRVPLSDTALTALARRGLIEWIEGADTTPRFDGDRPRLWCDLCRVTRPGELMLELLAEAGLVERTVLRHPLPPPPPGWLDPRPKLRPNLEGTGWTSAPSDREAAHP
jgi:hypothetical protein